MGEPEPGWGVQEILQEETEIEEGKRLAELEEMVAAVQANVVVPESGLVKVMLWLLQAEIVWLLRIILAMMDNA